MLPVRRPGWREQRLMRVKQHNRSRAIGVRHRQAGVIVAAGHSINGDIEQLGRKRPGHSCELFIHRIGHPVGQHTCITGRTRFIPSQYLGLTQYVEKFVIYSQYTRFRRNPTNEQIFSTEGAPITVKNLSFCGGIAQHIGPRYGRKLAATGQVAVHYGRDLLRRNAYTLPGKGHYRDSRGVIRTLRNFNGQLRPCTCGTYRQRDAHQGSQ